MIPDLPACFLLYISSIYSPNLFSPWKPIFNFINIFSTLFIFDFFHKEKTYCNSLTFIELRTYLSYIFAKWAFVHCPRVLINCLSFYFYEAMCSKFVILIIVICCALSIWPIIGLNPLKALFLFNLYNNPSQ